MKSQQHRPFFLALMGSASRQRCWALATLTMLLMSCSSLTPERINVLAQIAASAAQIGAQIWLEKHPEHRTSFDSVIIAIQALVRAGVTNQAAYAELLNSLPTATLAGPAGELYVTEDRLVIWDAELRKAVAVEGKAEEPVIRATVAGLRRGTMPKAPMPGKRVVQWPTTSYRTLTPGVPTNNAYPPGWQRLSEPYSGAWTIQTNTLLMHEGIVIRTNWTETVTVNLIGKTNVTRSVFDVVQAEGSVPVLTVRWQVGPRSVYHVEQRGDTNGPWLRFGSLTNISATGATNWVTPWPPNVSPGAWRVLRVR